MVDGDIPPSLMVLFLKKPKKLKQTVKAKKWPAAIGCGPEVDEEM